MKEFNIGHLQIGVSTTLCRYMLLPYLQTFMQKYPNIRVSINTQSTAQTLQLLEQKKLDIGLTAEPRSRRPELRFVHPKKIQDVFVATPQYLENLKSMFGPDCDVFQEGNIMLLDQNNMTRRHIDEYFKTMGIEPAQILEVTTMALLVDFAKIGIGVGCVIRGLVQKELDEGTLVEIPTACLIPSRNVGYVYNAGNTGKSLDAFLSILD